MAFSYKSYTASDSVNKAKTDLASHSTYTESSDVTNARTALQNHTANKVSDWTGGTYGQQLQDTLNKINNREKFSYDVDADSLYQQYKDKYISAGKTAMQDTIGQAAALTGGYGNSYATTAGYQAYQGYLDQLNDVIPELYQLAYDRYNQEGTDLQNQYSNLSNAYNTEYGEYRDQVSDWQTEASRLQSAYDNAVSNDYSKFSSDRDYYANLYESERDYDYSLYSDAYTRALQEYQLKQSSSSGSSSSSSKKTSPKADDTPTSTLTAAQVQYNTLQLARTGVSKSDIYNYVKEQATANGLTEAQAATIIKKGQSAVTSIAHGDKNSSTYEG